MDGRNNETQNQSLQQADLIDQLSNANEEIMSLRSENKRIMKFKVDINQLNEQNHFRKKGKVGI